MINKRKFWMTFVTVAMLFGVAVSMQSCGGSGGHTIYGGTK